MPSAKDSVRIPVKNNHFSRARNDVTATRIEPRDCVAPRLNKNPVTS